MHASNRTAVQRPAEGGVHHRAGGPVLHPVRGPERQAVPDRHQERLRLCQGQGLQTG